MCGPGTFSNGQASEYTYILSTYKMKEIIYTLGQVFLLIPNSL